MLSDILDFRKISLEVLRDASDGVIMDLRLWKKTTNIVNER